MGDGIGVPRSRLDSRRQYVLIDLAYTPPRVTWGALKVVALAKGEKPSFVPVEPSAQAVANECFDAVRAVVEEEGGEMVLGWRVWEAPRVYVEAEYHAVWRDPGGNLRDVSRTEGEEQILFSVDPEMRWKGRPIDSVRFALTSDPIAKELFACMERKFAYRSSHGNGLVSVPVDVVRGFELASSQAELFYRLVHARRDRNDRCYCGTGKSFRDCCRG